MKLTINAMVCQNHRIINNDCHNCSDSCADKAIEVKNGVVSLLKNDCRECGLCRLVCPTKAIEFSNEHRYPIKEIVAKREIYCRSLNENGYVKCLGSLDAVEIILLGIQAQTVITIDADYCSQCNELVMPYFKQELVKANKFLQSIECAPVRVAMKAKNVVGKLERRDVLDLLFTKLQRQISDALPISVDRVSQRRRLAEELARRTELPTMQNNGIFFGIKQNDSCTLCGICAKVCVGGALKKLADRQQKKWRLEFDAAACNGCKSCSKICPQNSLVVGSEYCDTVAMINRQVQTITERPLYLCRECGTEPVMEQTGLCLSCQAKQKNKMQAIY